MKQLRIYVAGPYTAPTEEGREQNVNVAIDAAIQLLRLGHLPFVPHLTHYVDLRATAIGQPLAWSDYIQWDLGWLGVADALLFLGSSPGADIELNHAMALGLQIFRTLREVPKVLPVNALD